MYWEWQVCYFCIKINFKKESIYSFSKVKEVRVISKTTDVVTVLVKNFRGGQWNLPFFLFFIFHFLD